MTHINIAVGPVSQNPPMAYSKPRLQRSALRRCASGPLRYLEPGVCLNGVCALAVLIAAVMPFTVLANDARTTDPRVLLTQYKCYLCHADRETKAGPAYVDVAARLRDHPKAVSRIAMEIRRGIRRGGPWHMPPHPEVSLADARVMARYIMSLGR